MKLVVRRGSRVKGGIAYLGGVEEETPVAQGKATEGFVLNISADSINVPHMYLPMIIHEDRRPNTPPAGRNEPDSKYTRLYHLGSLRIIPRAAMVILLKRPEQGCVGH